MPLLTTRIDEFGDASRWVEMDQASDGDLSHRANTIGERVKREEENWDWG